jgi:RNA polymerase sigma-70 factor (ECF subfamily)
LIKKIQAGDTEAFDILVRKYYCSIYQFCYRRLNGDAATAEDITQDVFLKLLENIHKVRMLGKFQNYLLTIAANTCNNHYKKAKPIYTGLNTLEIADDSGSSLEKVVQTENQAAVQHAINRLPDYQKEAIILRFYYDLKIREIAAISKVKLQTYFGIVQPIIMLVFNLGLTTIFYILTRSTFKRHQVAG